MAPPAGRTALFALAWFAVFTLAFFYVPQWILTRLTPVPRDVRGWLSVAWFGAAFVACGYAAWRGSGRALRESGARPSGARQRGA